MQLTGLSGQSVGMEGKQRAETGIDAGDADFVVGSCRAGSSSAHLTARGLALLAILGRIGATVFAIILAGVRAA